MAKTPKSLVLEFWSNAELKYDHAPWSLRVLSCADRQWNVASTNLCDPRRRELCAEEGLCGRARPGCYTDMLRMAGKKPSDKLLAADKKKIARIQGQYFKECRRLTVTVEEA